jgi:hypothetical protein
MNLAGRIARLERRHGSGPCPGCGVPRDPSREAGVRRFEVVCVRDGRGLVARVVIF